MAVEVTFGPDPGGRLRQESSQAGPIIDGLDVRARDAGRLEGSGSLLTRHIPLIYDQPRNRPGPWE